MRHLLKTYALLFILCLCGVSISAHAWKMEAGKLSLSATSSLNQLQSHTFQQIYDTPPIVITLPTSAGSHTGAIRISNVSTTGFRMSTVEPRSNDGPHAAMTVSYIAIEAGTHTFPNGETIEAGIVTTDKIQFNGVGSGKGKGTDWEKLSFANTFNKPVFLANIQTTANEINAIPKNPSHPWLTVAVNNLKNNKTDIALERSEVYDQIDKKGKFEFNDLGNSEDIGYVIMDKGLQGSFNASGNVLIKFESIYNTKTLDGWHDGCDSVNYSGTYSSSPIVVASLSTRNEKDGGWLRACSVNASRIQLTIDEDISQDNERNHKNEDASILLFSDTFFYDSNAPTTLTTASALMLESNTASLSPNGFTTINFEQIYEYPPAVFLLEDSQNPEPSSVRIRNITTQSFDVVPVEPDSKVSDALDQTTTINYLAISKGQFAFPDGKKIEIGPVVPPNEIINFQAKRLSGDSWFNFNFATSFSSTPALLTQIQSMNSEPGHIPGSPSRPWMTSAVSNVTSAGGRIALDRAETNTGTINAAEEIAFLATEGGVIGNFKAVSGNNISSEAQVTPDNVAGTRSCYNYNFLQAYPSPPLVIGSQMTWDGGDGGWLRRCSTTNNNVSIRIEEDWAADTDNSHTTERAGFLAFSEPFYADLSLIANYQLEGPSWNGTIGEVLDSSNSGLNGKILGNTKAFPAKVCNGATFDGTGDYIEVPDNAILDISDELTVMAWIRPRAFPSSDLMTIVSKDTNFEFHIDPSGKILWWWNNSSGASRSFTSNATSLTLHDWQHVAITYSKSAGSQKIFIDGIETNTQNYANESLINNNLPLFIGTDYNYRSRDFSGSIDEVKIFKRALPTNAIQKYAAETRPCASCVLGSFDISQPTYTLACPETRAEINITARCVDGTIKTDYSGTVNLSAPSGSSFFDSDKAGNSITTLTYSFADNGNKKAYLYFNNEADDIKVTASDSTASVSSTPLDGAGTDFKTFGFRVSQDPANFVCSTATSMTLQAYGKTNQGTGESCEVITGFSGNKTFDTWFNATVNDDAIPDSVSNDLIVNGTAISKTASEATANDNLTLNFAKGESSFNISYANAAKILDLNFRYDAAPYDGTLPDSEMAASTVPFVAYPANFLISAKSGLTKINGSSFNATTTHKAGRTFELDIAAQCDDGAGTLSTATDYQPTNGTDSIMTYLQRTGPIGGSSVDGDMRISASVILTSDDDPSITWKSSGLGASDFSSGVYSFNGASYSEVGTTTLYAQGNNYFGENISQSVIDIGRFIPDHFTVTVNSGSFEPFCNIGSTPDFSYIGQAISYAAAPSLTIQAMNASSPSQTTQNYTESNFLKLTTADAYIERNFPNSDNSNTGTSGSLLALNVSENTPSSFTSATAGVITYTFDSADTVTYIRNAQSLVSPFNSAIKIDINKVEDDDGVASIPASFDVLPTSIELRYGRWKVENTFGPETKDLSIPMRTEYWDGTNFATNESDHCSSFDASDITLTSSLSGGTTSVSGNGMLISGKAPLGSQLSLSAPGAENTGNVELEFQVDSWLQYDWDNNPVTADTNPTSVASFGQFRGHDRMIYWREVSN